jgi:hypothetical protein
MCNVGGIGRDGKTVHERRRPPGRKQMKHNFLYGKTQDGQVTGTTERCVTSGNWNSISKECVGRSVLTTRILKARLLEV